MMRVAFYTLGCKVNQYETQALKEKFMARGYEIVSEVDYADVYVVNTCTVTNLADRKSRQYIRRMKKVNPESITAVIGCYAQISPDQVQSIEGVNIIAGTNEKNNLPDYVDHFIAQRIGGEKGKLVSEFPQISHIRPYDELSEYEETGLITTMDSRKRAFIKIQEGCNQFCSYCIIPYARGGIRSRAIEDIRAEANKLIQSGFKELVLTGINTALYGMEDRSQENRQGIGKVIHELDLLPGEFRIRLGSLEPTVINAKKAKALLDYQKLCPHMHLSAQSGSDRVLEKMNRHYSKQEYLEIVETLRKQDKWYGLTTDIIVGFPGETDEDFQETLDLVEQVGFLKVHVFPYSKRPGTVAATMDGQISDELKRQRSKALMAKAEQGAARFLESTLGSERQVLFEEYEEETGLISGFSDNYIKVYCQADHKGQAERLFDQFVTVRFLDLYKEGVNATL